jgi:hypothetical protein
MGNRDSLLRIRYLVLNRAVIVGTAAVRASALFAVGFDIVVAELANLENTVSAPLCGSGIHGMTWEHT